MIRELWRLPDLQVTRMDGSVGTLSQVVMQMDTWIGFYKNLDYGGYINQIPEGSTPLILNGKWV